MNPIRTILALLLATAAFAQAQPVINKCIIGGKTIYSDEKCPTGASREQVEINHAAGIVSPDRETVTDTVNRMYDERRVNTAPDRSITRTITRDGKTVERTDENPLPEKASAQSPDKKTLCDSISQRIENLDAQARQPQTARGQERIRRAKEKQRAKAFNAKC